MENFLSPVNSEKVAPVAVPDVFIETRKEHIA
jgi:hypothetical protein